MFYFWYPTRLIHDVGDIHVILGGLGQHTTALQVPRRVGLVRSENLLEERAFNATCRRAAARQVRHRCAGNKQVCAEPAISALNMQLSIHIAARTQAAARGRCRSTAHTDGQTDTRPFY